MHFQHRKTLAVLLLAAFSCLFCGSQFLPVSVANFEPVAEKPAANANPVLADPIDKALEGMATFDFVDTPLKDAMAQIAADHSLPITIDKVAIEDSGYDLDLPMTGRANGQDLRSAMRLLFMEVDFVAVIKHKTLMITTMEAISNNPEKYMQTELYDITDLRGFSTDELIMNIQDTIDPQSWLETNGGPGTINDLVSEKKIVLVISHTSEMHYEIKEFLEKLRAIENSN